MLATYWSTGTCGLDRPIGDACTRARPRRRRRLSLHMEELTHSLLAGGSSPPPTLARTIIAVAGAVRERSRETASRIYHIAGRAGGAYAHARSCARRTTSRSPPPRKYTRIVYAWRARPDLYIHSSHLMGYPHHFILNHRVC